MTYVPDIWWFINCFYAKETKTYKTRNQSERGGPALEKVS